MPSVGQSQRPGNDNSIIKRQHDQNKSGFFGGPAFIQPIRAI